MFVIASPKSWHARLPERLSALCGHTFTLIDKPEDLSVARLKGLGAEMVFLPHWSHIIPAEVYEAVPCVVFHMTDLPYGRGGSPLQNLIVRGHESTVISALKCEQGLDTGPVYLKKPLSLLGSAQEIFLRATDVIIRMIVEIVEQRPEPVPQTGEPTHFARRSPDESNFSDAADLAEVYNRIRMLDAEGYPPAFLNMGGMRLEFTRASQRPDCVEADVRITFPRSDKAEP